MDKERKKQQNKININKKEKREAYIIFFFDSLIDFHFGTIVISYSVLERKYLLHRNKCEFLLLLYCVIIDWKNQIHINFVIYLRKSNFCADL